LITALAARSWQRLSAGAGARGPREYHWARVPIEAGAPAGRGHWLLARRCLHDPPGLRQSGRIPSPETLTRRPRVPDIPTTTAVGMVAGG